MTAETYEGTILHGPEFDDIRGRIVVEHDRIEAIEEDDVAGDDIIIPAFVNAHTHVGDSIAKEAGEGLSLTELVAPPDGLKHRLLRAADPDEQATAIRRTAAFMERTGTAAYLDFREGDVDGVELLREAMADLDVEARAFARGSVAALDRGDGFGAPSARDGEYSDEREAAAARGKPFGIHAGERDSDDIDGAFDLDPDFIVHMVHPTQAHLERLERAEIPVVVCPRSNLATNAGVPPVRELLERTTVALGTDNVMLNSPSMFREMEVTAKLADVSAREVLRMATLSGAEIADLDYGCLEPGRRAKLVVLDGDSDNLSGAKSIVRAVVRRAGIGDVKTVRI